MVGQAIALCGLSCFAVSRQADRRQKAIVCPTGFDAESMSCGWVSGEKTREKEIRPEKANLSGRWWAEFAPWRGADRQSGQLQRQLQGSCLIVWCGGKTFQESAEKIPLDTDAP